MSRFTDRIRGAWQMLLYGQTREEFNITPLQSAEMDSFIRRCGDIYEGKPDWIDEDEHIKTVNFAKSVCSETARLACLDIDIKAEGSARAEWIQKQMKAVKPQLRRWIEYGLGYGTVILKPNGDDVDFILPNQFQVTETRNGLIYGCVFQESQYDVDSEKWYTRLEYHHFLSDGRYRVENRCYIGDAQYDTARRVDILKTPWAGLDEEMTATGVEEPLFGVFTCPAANNVDIRSALGVPVFTDAIEELRDLDVAYSRNAKEIWDSKRLVLLDADRLLPQKGRASLSARQQMADAMGLPEYIKTVEGMDNGDVYHEINPALQTATRITGIDNLLSQIGYKCGYSNGYFVFNQKTGMITATQVEAEDRRTIQLIKDVRDRLETCVTSLAYALDKFADGYKLAPSGKYDLTYNFADVTYNVEEDRMRWWNYVQAGKVPAWRYFVKFEGMSEDEAREMVEEAQPVEDLFGGMLGGMMAQAEQNGEAQPGETPEAE